MPPLPSSSCSLYAPSTAPRRFSGSSAERAGVGGGLVGDFGGGVLLRPLGDSIFVRSSRLTSLVPIASDGCESRSSPASGGALLMSICSDCVGSRAPSRPVSGLSGTRERGSRVVMCTQHPTLSRGCVARYRQ